MLIAPSLRRSSAGSRFDKSHGSIAWINFRAPQAREWIRFDSSRVRNAGRSSFSARTATMVIGTASRSAGRSREPGAHARRVRVISAAPRDVSIIRTETALIEVTVA